MASTRAQRLVFAAILMITVALGTRSITDEASVMLGGDMARYVMNGVFLRDLIAAGGAWSVDDLIGYAERYYARYPALSLGHHPPLPYVALVPFLEIFGVTLFAARLAALSFFLAATWGLHALVKRLLGWEAAAWAALLFVTNLYVLRAGQYLLSEMPMLVFILASLNALFAYCDTGKTRYFVWFVIALTASLYAKQLSAFMIPVYGLILVTQLGWRSLLRRPVIIMTVVCAALVAPLAAMTLELAPSNVAIVTQATTGLVTGGRPKTVPDILAAVMWTHLSLPALLVVAAGTLTLVLRANRRVVITGLAWILTVVAGTVAFAGGVEPARYSFGAMPAYCLLAAGLATGFASRVVRWTAVIALSGAVLWQTWIIRDAQPSGAGGYEAAAEYVLGHSQQPAILFDGVADTGYFVFFVRKHDPEGRFMVLRADKIVARPAGDPAGPIAGVHKPEDVYTVLQRFGIQFVVVEERNRGLIPLKILQAELETDRFIERQRIPIVTRDPMAKGRSLVIYEFKDAQPADPEAELDIDIPKGGREIKIRMKDLIGETGRPNR